MATQTDNLMLLDDSGFPRIIDTSNDEIALSVPFFMNSGASVTGNLVVSGDIVSVGAQNLVVQDSFIDLGLGNATTTAKAAGFSFSIAQNTTSVTTVGGEEITEMVAGGASAPYLVTSSTSEFAAGDILALTGTGDGSNDGLYVVNSISVDAGGAGIDHIVLKGTGGTAPNGSVPFVQTQVSSLSGETAKAYKIDISILVVADGSNFPDSGGSPFTEGDYLSIFAQNAVESDFTSNGAYSALGAAAATLQSAYDSGNTILTEAGRPFQVTMLQDGAGFSVLADANGAGEVVFGQSGGNAIDSFIVNSVGAVNLSASGAATLSGVGLTLEGGSGAFSLQSDTNSVINVAGVTQTLGIDATGSVSINSSAGLLQIGNSAVAQQIQIGGDTGTRTEVELNAIEVDINGGATGVLIDALDAGSIDIGTSTDGASDTSAINIGTSATARTITVGNSSSAQLNLNADDVNVSGTTTLDLESATIQIGANTGSGKTINIGESTQANPINIDSGSGALTVETGASSTINVAGVGATLDIDATSNVSINASAGAINVGNDDVDQAINIGTDGERAISIGTDNGTGTAPSTSVGIEAAAINIGTGTVAGATITIGESSQANAITIDAGTDSITLEADDGIVVNNDITFGTNNVGITGTAGENLAAGDLVCVVNNAGAPNYFKADAGHASDDNQKILHAVVRETISSGNPGPLTGMPGTIAYVSFKTAPAAATDIGKPVYLYDANGTAADEGKASLTAPTRSTTVVFRIGYLYDDTAVSGLYPVLIQPQYIAKRP